MRSLLVRPFIIGCALAQALSGVPADACTSFLIRHSTGPLMAKNFDWEVADGLLVVNPRGLAKTALVPEGVKPVRWTSHYGSLTFNQYGREFPIGGMNETGLAMEVLWLADTVYPEPGDHAGIGALQWVQYCLDSFRTVTDVVASASELAITDSAPLHFLACDPTGNCAVIEFLDGKLVARYERTLPLAALTNDTYNDSLEFLNRTLGYGGAPVKPEGAGSLARYARAANGAHAVRATTGEQPPIAETFAVLADVAQADSTRWSIVYELQKGRVHFRTPGNGSTRTVDLSKLDLDCTAEPLVLDLMTEGSGDVTAKLTPYSSAANLKTIRAGLTAERITAPSEEAIQTRAAYPDKLLCTFARAEE
jgi:choloylglycine hydrolase